MNKNTFYLLIAAAVLLSVFNYKYYTGAKKELSQSNTQLNEFKTEIKQIIYLQKKYSYKPVKLKFCKIKDEGGSVIVDCKGLDKPKVRIVQNYLIMGGYKINKFNIYKDGKLLSFEAEILK
jgi:hypothetical protein